MAEGEIFGGRKGSSQFWMDSKGDIDGKKEFKGSFCMTHTHTCTVRSAMEVS